MCSSPDGYGSISSTYVFCGVGVSPGAGFGDVEGPLVLPDALPLRLDRLSGRTAPSSLQIRSCNEKASRARGLGKLPRRRRVRSLRLRKKLLHAVQCNRQRSSQMLELFPESARVDERRAGARRRCRASELAERVRHAARRLLRGDAPRAGARISRRPRRSALVVYGTKAFANVALLRLLAEEGSAPTSSTARRARVRPAAGIAGERLVVHGNNKSDEELRAAAAVRARSSCSTRPTRPSARGRRRRAARPRPRDARRRRGHARGDPDRRTTGRSSGCRRRGARAGRGRARAGLDVEGLHVHVGSQLARLRRTGGDDRRGSRAFAARCREELGWSRAVLDLGGGLGIRHHRDEQVPSRRVRGARSRDRPHGVRRGGLPEPEVCSSRAARSSAARA